MREFVCLQFDLDMLKVLHDIDIIYISRYLQDQQAVINSSGPKLRLADELKTPHKDLTTTPKTMEKVERDHIIRVLDQTHWKVSGKNGASEILGLNVSTLRARMRKLGIRRP